jgi:hypothetical protein
VVIADTDPGDGAGRLSRREVPLPEGVSLLDESVELLQLVVLVVAVDLMEGRLELEAATGPRPEPEPHEDLARSFVDHALDLERVLLPGLAEGPEESP